MVFSTQNLVVIPPNQPHPVFQVNIFFPEACGTAQIIGLSGLHLWCVSLWEQRGPTATQTLRVMCLSIMRDTTVQHTDVVSAFVMHGFEGFRIFSGSVFYYSL